MLHRSNPLWKWSATIACVVCSALPAYGQVIRCTDAKTGEVTYTDGKCATGAVAREVEAKRTPEEIEQDRRTAERALELKQQRLQAESAASSAQSQRELEQERLRAARAANAAPAAKDYGNSAECAKSRRNLELLSAGVSRTNYDQDMRLEAAQRQMDLDCLGPQGYAELERARAAQPLIVVTPQRRPVHTPPATVPQQPYITSCSSFYCIDSTGARYPRSGPGQFPGNGGVCKSKGGQAPC